MSKCHNCRKADTLEGYARCEACLNKDLLDKRRRYLDPEKRARMLEHGQKMKEKYKAEGRCIKCAAPLDGEAMAKGYVTCINCRQRRRLI